MEIPSADAKDDPNASRTSSRSAAWTEEEPSLADLDLCSVRGEDEDQDQEEDEDDVVVCCESFSSAEDEGLRALGARVKGPVDELCVHPPSASAYCR